MQSDAIPGRLQALLALWVPVHIKKKINEGLNAYSNNCDDHIREFRMMKSERRAYIHSLNAQLSHNSSIIVMAIRELCHVIQQATKDGALRTARI